MSGEGPEIYGWLAGWCMGDQLALLGPWCTAPLGEARDGK